MNFCLYHEHCYDGMAAAWAIWMKYPDWTFVPVNYKQPVPDLASLAAQAAEGVDQVIIVDFSYPADTLHELCDLAKFVTVLDHHKTAQKDLENFERPDALVVFDMERSGAALAWDHVYPMWPYPPLIKYVQDRDLWRWELPHTREVNAWLRTFELGSMFIFDSIAGTLDDPDGFKHAALSGADILKHQAKMVELAKSQVAYMTVGGHADVPVVNSCLYQSEIGSELAEGHPFAVVWYIDCDGKVRHSFRSKDEGVNVGELCRRWGGGGHRNAAGLITGPTQSPVLCRLWSDVNLIKVETF